MKRGALLGVVCLLAATLIGVAGVSAADPAHGSLVMGIRIHVSPDGADTRPGTVQAPVKTPEAARNLARKHASREPVTIIFADGVYYLDQTLLLTDADSGSKSAPVVSLFHEIGTVEKQGAGVQISMSRRITVRHCSIHDTSRAGININEGTWGGHLIEGCDVFNTVQETGDHGSFNSWGRDRYWLPRKGCGETVAAVAANPKLPFLDAMETNIIRESRWRCDHGWDIDLDDGSSNYEIYNNLMLHGGLKFREGYRRIGTNNIIVDNSFYPSVWYPKSGDVFAHNIVMGAYRPAFMYDNWDGELDRNLFTTSHQDRVMFAAHGADANSMVGDPQFADPAKGDFTVRNEALAKAIGFKNFPMDRFGVQKPALKAIAKTPVMPNPVIKPDLTPAAAPAAGPAATVWLGATLGEPKGETLSAYGVAFDSGGVAIEKIQRNSPLGGAGGLREGDLIQGLNGGKITSIADLKRVVGGIKDGKLALRVIRSQKEETVELKLGLTGLHPDSAK